MAVVTLATFTEENVSDWFATRDINKARPYVDLVRDLDERAAEAIEAQATIGASR